MGAPSAPAQSNRRAMIMLAVGGGALLLFLLVTKVLGGGGGGDDLSAPITVPPGSGTPRTTVTTGVVPGAPGEAPAPETFEVFSTKNPFTPLVGAAGGGGTTGGGGTSTGGGTVVTTPPTGGGTTVTTPPGGGGGGGGGTSTGGGTTATSAPPGTGGSPTEPRSSQRVALLDVYEQGGKRVANVRVNDTVYEAVAPGEQFGTSFQLVSLDGSCGTFLFGDDRFRLCQGQEVLK
ncbi:MAG TPA: hypothetical protein VFK42_02495 [Acidimicrobiales bacterium]|nr:hypothetical protein [Acidimicrobiales bacterium]